jgi:hypothetical protein
MSTLNSLDKQTKFELINCIEEAVVNADHPYTAKIMQYNPKFPRYLYKAIKKVLAVDEELTKELLAMCKGNCCAEDKECCTDAEC